jgi:adenosylcobinamide kinase/adenosylcobinamide-phosphate guanylyltransferase
MGRFIFITGGARSGKSSYAERSARLICGENAQVGAIGYVATAVAMDDEFKERIATHRQRRNDVFQTYEEPLMIDRATENALARHPVVVLECLTVWLGNVFMRPFPPEDAEPFAMERIDRLLAALPLTPSTLLVISNEVGLGIVPGDAMSRRYRDVHGRINQRIAAAAHEAWFVVSGIPMRLK